MTRPEHDTPLCPCGGPLTTLTKDHRSALDEPRIRCCACGTTSDADGESLRRAQRADVAWLRLDGGSRHLIWVLDGRAGDESECVDR